MKNKISDLNNHLFAQLERLADEDMSPEQVETEVKRAGAIVELADQIAGNARMTITAAKLYAEHGEKLLPYLPQIGNAKPSEPTE